MVKIQKSICKLFLNIRIIPWKMLNPTHGLKHQSISNSAQYVTLDSKLCLSLAFYFDNPTNNTETGTGTAYTGGTTNSKPPGPIIVIDQSEILSRSQMQCTTLFLGGAQLCCLFHQPRQAARIWCRIPIS